MMQSEHVAVYVPALNRGGAERVAALLATGFFQAGRRTTLLVDFEASENRALVAPGIETVVLGRSHLTATLALARFLRQRRPDIALAIGGAADVKLAAARLLSGSRCPIVLSYHGRSDVGRGRLGHASYTLARRLSRRAAMVCVSDGLADHLCNDWHVPRERVTRIYNPVSVEHALPVSREELAQRPPVVMSVGRLNREKGFAALIAALPLIQSDARLVIYGEGPERDALQATAAELGVADRLHLAGYRDNPWPCYATARCFALASPKEAFGNVVVEALASGLPVIATRSGGPDEILDHGRIGALVDNGDIPALADAINRALADPGDPLPRVAHARTFDVNTAVANYLALFNRMLKR
ncbi:glycosyltransferase [Bradyrhizobium sp. 2TAF24]|uniref:glycosyltransferase n=1 Tax=Bradyrhizobium sp. 2TAF24 TaxID=3233011 RepID=UPI003F92F2AE